MPAKYDDVMRKAADALLSKGREIIENAADGNCCIDAVLGEFTDDTRVVAVDRVRARLCDVFEHTTVPMIAKAIDEEMRTVKAWSRAAWVAKFRGRGVYLPTLIMAYVLGEVEFVERSVRLWIYYPKHATDVLGAERGPCVLYENAAAEALRSRERMADIELLSVPEVSHTVRLKRVDNRVTYDSIPLFARRVKNTAFFDEMSLQLVEDDSDDEQRVERERVANAMRALRARRREAAVATTVKKEARNRDAAPVKREPGAAAVKRERPTADAADVANQSGVVEPRPPTLVTKRAKVEAT